jgi:DNA modification methylase
VIEPYYDRDGITIYHGDCLDVLPQLEAVDHVITDPPYSEHVHKNARAGSRPLVRKGFVADYSRSAEFGFDALPETTRCSVSREFARLTQRWALVFSDVESCHSWREALTENGLEYVRTGSWVKLNATPQFTGDRPAPGYETITIVHPSGRKRWNGGGSHGVWTHAIEQNRGGNNPRLHTTQKPLDLMRELVSLFTDPGDLILDPFMGSGTTLRAAKDLGRRAIGIEINEAYCEIAVKRLAQEVLL